MTFKENNFNSPDNNNIEQSKKKENFFKRFMNSPLLQRALLAALLIVASPSDIKKEAVDDKNINPTEVLNDKIKEFSGDSLIINHSSNVPYDEDLSDEDFKKGLEYNGPESVPDPDPFPIKR